MTRLRSTLPALIALAALGLLLLAPVGPAQATYLPPTLTPQGEKVSEGASLAMVAVRLSAKATKKLTVPYKTVAGTAKPGKDFKATSGKLTIKKGAKSANIYIPLIDDKVTEPTEQFTVKLTDGGPYNLSTTTATITIKDDDNPVVTQWSGDLTVHVTKDQNNSSTISHEDWTMQLHLVLERPDPVVSTWVPTSASTWTAHGTRTSTYPTDECIATPTRWEIDTEGAFVADPVSQNPGEGESSYWLKDNTGDASIDKEAPFFPVMEVGTTLVPTTRYDYWDYTHTCSEHVSDALLTLGFQTDWRTSDPVGHPGTFPLILTIKGGRETSLTADFEDTYTQPSGSGDIVTHSTVTGTLTPSTTA